MIVDRIENRASYYGLLPQLQEAMEFALGLAQKPAGRYEYDGLPAGSVYAMIQEGETLPFDEGQVEAHRNYLDVQIMLEGKEVVFYHDIAGLEETVPYNKEADIIFYRKAGQPLEIEQGMFYLVLPQDGHMPCRYLQSPGSYRKIVLKIRL